MDAMVGNCRNALTAMLMKLPALLAAIDPFQPVNHLESGRSASGVCSVITA